MNKVLIIGASGFLGNVIYKELLSYYDTYGTYCTQEGLFGQNQVFFKYDASEDSLTEVLQHVQPNVIISAFKAESEHWINAHLQLVDYVNHRPSCQLIYLSSYVVFDAQTKFPSYESDKPMAESGYGKLTISLEKLLQEHIPAQHCIVRLPLVLGINSPQITQLRQAIRHQATFEVFPNLIISTTTADKLAQQIQYIVNQRLLGIYHLSSTDVIHHDDLFKEISEKLANKFPIFKSVYSSNDDRYLAILPRDNQLPETYQISVAEVIESSSLSEDIVTLKTSS